jgi:ATP-binding cassette, subfamily B, bacterial PglK
MLKENFQYLNKILTKKEYIYLYIYFIFSVLIGVLETIGVGILPAFFSVLIDKNILINKFDFNEDMQNIIVNLFDKDNLIVLLCVGIVIFFIFKSIILFFFGFFDAKLTRDFKISISSQLFKIYINKNYLFHSSNNPIILGRNISSEVNTSVAHMKSFLIIIKESIQLILIFSLLLFANLKVTTSIFALFLLLTIIYLKFFGKKMKQKSEIAFYERGHKSKIIHQILNAIIEVKIYNRENFIIKKFTDSIKKEFQSKMFLDVVNKIPKIFVEIFIVSLVCFTIVVCVRLGFNIEAIISIIALYFFAALRSYPSFNSFLQQKMALINGRVSIEKLSNEFKKSKLNSDNQKTEHSISKFNKSIEFQNISFNYPDRENSLNNLNLKISKNTLIGIKGETGSGKSTLIKIIMGLLQPTSGKILLDGKELHLSENNLKDIISYVPQNFYILDDTILENIIFSEENNKPDYKKISNVTKLSQLDGVINSLPKGINTIVGSTGQLLSGGQAQRLALARALYQEREILILDEATNALDSNTEKLIIENILNLKKSKTIIIISHNSDILKFCDHTYEITR